MQSPSLLFAETVRVLSTAARALGLDVPAIRSRPRRDDVDRSIRRLPDGQAVVSVRLEGRPFAAVQADLVEAFVAANGFSGADASLVRRNLWASLDSMASAATQPVPTGPEPRAAVVAPAALVAVAAA